MKVNRKTVLSTAAVLGVAALVAGGTIAYFTDSENAVNNFTVGDVKIEMFESQLHRQNSGRTGSFDHLASDNDYCTYTGTNIDGNTGAGPQPISGTTALNYESARYCTPGMDANNTDGISAVDEHHTAANRTWGYSDATIIADSDNYKAGDTTADTSDDGYFTRVSQNVVPGQWIRKFTYVKNGDSVNANYNGSDAYVLIRYMVPVAYADDLDLKIPGTPYEEDVDANTDGVQGYFTAVNKSGDTYSAYQLTANGVDDYQGYEENGYKVYAAVTTNAVKPGEMTFWSPVNTIRIKTDRQNVDPNAEKYVAPGALKEVKVEAQAIQAKTFNDAIDAINHL